MQLLALVELSCSSEVGGGIPGAPYPARASIEGVSGLAVAAPRIERMARLGRFFRVWQPAQGSRWAM
jgi:hypothetical protein